MTQEEAAIADCIRDEVEFLRSFHDGCDHEGLTHSEMCWTHPDWCSLAQRVYELEARIAVPA